MAAPIPTVPRILPAAATPFLWSVMIPCYNAPPDYLAATLRSVLQQDPGRELMQIEVIDDASPNGAPVELVKKIAGDRVTVQREEKNRGLAGIWNRCIERAQGRWVHILHQDDLVRPGFYEKFKVGAESPAAPGLMYCRHAFIDGQGKLGWLSDLEAEQPGCLPDALPRQVRKQLIQTPSVVVRRAAYEAVGGFRSDLCFTLDWEMWCRLAQKFPVWFEPEVLAHYRLHAGAETSRLRLAGQDIEDVCKCIEIISGYIADPATAADARRAARRRYALLALGNAENLILKKEFQAAGRQVRGALKCEVSPPVARQILRLALLAAKFPVKKSKPMSCLQGEA
jgi:glycosyltransferase involved in cell wall biosynthesis